MYRFLALILGAFIPSQPLCALTLSDLNSSSINGGVAIVSAADGSAMTMLTLHPDLGLSSFKLGLDVNVLLDPAKQPASYQPVVVRFVEYDDGGFGVAYGLLKGITYGYGLLMSSYGTAQSGQSVFTPEQAGIKVYTKWFQPLGIYVLSTNSSLVSLRVTEALSNDFFFGHPLIAGQTYVYDRDGVVTGAGTRLGSDQGALGADIGVPMIEGQWDIFTEYALLNNFGSGFSAGTRYKLSEMFDASIAYQILNGRFVPAYFNSTYEDAPTDLTSVTSSDKAGWFGSLGANVMDFVRIEGSYASYTTGSGAKSDTLQLSAGVREINGISGVATYAQPNFSGLSSLSSNNATLKTDVSYRLNNYSKLIVHYSKVYVSSVQVDVSYSTEIVFNLPVSF